MTIIPSPIRVLCVDDDDVDRETVRRALRRSGLCFELVEASSGVEALELWDRDTFDCVLLDYLMDDIDGLSLFHQLADLAPGVPIAAIFLTGHRNEDLAVEVIEAGAYDFVAKDELTTSVLKRAIQYALARKQHLQQLNRLANEDSLTGLANRGLFFRLTEQALANVRRYGQHYAIMLIDLDHFKTVNDTLGHPAGDRLLVQAARRLSTLVRSGDSVARLGGDEFGVLAQLKNGEDGAGRLAERILEAFSRPFEIDGHKWHLSASIGVSVCNQDGLKVETLLKNADLALYKAKQDSRAAYRYFTEDMNERASKRRSIEVALRSADRDSEFELHYQPRIDPWNWGLMGAEALIRWRRPGHGTVAPLDFIPLAEATRLILPLGRWVLKQACAQCAAWRKEGGPLLAVSVNLSPVQLRDASIVDTVQAALDQAQLDPRFLELEITETAAMDDEIAVSKTLNRLSALGVSLAVDDFGTGYSSLSRLRDLPVDKLKVDRSFVADLARGIPGGRIVEFVVSLGRHLNLGIVAEGVEDGRTVDKLRALGCTEVQGYHISRPLPDDQFRAWCTDWLDRPLAALTPRRVAAPALLGHA